MKIYVTILSTLLLANTAAFAKPISQVTETSSLSRAVLEMVAQDDSTHENVEQAVLDTHESQKANSLSHAVLAIQGVKTNLRLNSDSEVSYSQYSHEDEKNNSLGRGALARK
ncbi:MAG: hypothetical protein COA63_001090 [Methylophaga sp.]|nr:hypothetical protein [Methylophaga sp.]